MCSGHQGRNTDSLFSEKLGRTRAEARRIFEEASGIECGFEKDGLMVQA
jgi:hypothetical protein